MRERALPREVAVAAAREAVRRSRVRREGERGDPPPAVPSAPASSGAVAGEERPDVRPGRAAGLRDRAVEWVRVRCGIRLRTVLALGVVLCVAAGLAVHHFWTGRPQPVRAGEVRPQPRPGPRPETGPSGAGAGHGRVLVIDVVGRVREPGVYRMPPGSRVADVLKKAGGVRPGTDVRGLNRARPLVDGEQITAGGAPGSGGAPGAGAGTPPGASAGAAGEAPGGPSVSLNSATAEQLETLPGVGPVLARNLVAFREQNGGFRSVDQLKEVNGIGERRFADLRPRVTP